MNGNPPLLSAELLSEFEDLLRRHTGGAVSRSRGETGSVAQLADVERSLGLRLPNEARTWWSWWNPKLPIELIPNIELVSLDTAVAMYRVRRELGQSAAEQARREGLSMLADPELWWRRCWFPFLGPFQHDTVAIDCKVPADEPTPVLRITATAVGDEGYDDPRSPSLGTLVRHWIQLLRAGEYTFDQDRSAWQFYPADQSLWVDPS